MAALGFHPGSGGAARGCSVGPQTSSAVSRIRGHRSPRNAAAVGGVLSLSLRMSLSFPARWKFAGFGFFLHINPASGGADQKYFPKSWLHFVPPLPGEKSWSRPSGSHPRPILQDLPSFPTNPSMLPTESSKSRPNIPCSGFTTHVVINRDLEANPNFPAPCLLLCSSIPTASPWE